MQNFQNTFLFLCFILITAHIKITMKITVQSSSSNPVATDDTDITTILMFTGVWMIVDNTGESTDDLSVEVIATVVVWELKEAKKHKVNRDCLLCVYCIYCYTHLQNTKCYKVIQSVSQCWCHKNWQFALEFVLDWLLLFK